MLRHRRRVGSAVTTVRPGQFVDGSFCISDNTCPHCRRGFQSACQQREFMTGAQEGRPSRDEYLIVDGGKLAGAGAHSYSAGDATGGSEEAAKFKSAHRQSA